MSKQFTYPMYTVWTIDNKDYDFQTLEEAFKFFDENKDAQIINRHDDYALNGPVSIIQRLF